MEIITIRDVYGRSCRVALEDLLNTSRYRIQVPLRNRKGVKFSDLEYPKRGKATTIHRENIAFPTLPTPAA